MTKEKKKISVPVEKKRKRQETASKQFSAPQLSALLDSAMDAVICVNVNQEIILFNRAAEEMFGYPVSAALGKSLDTLIPERFRTRHREHIRHFAESGSTLRHMGSLGEIVGLKADGTEFPIEASISQSKHFDDGCFVVILRDVTERKVLESQIRDSETRYRRIVELSREGILTTDADGVIQFANSRFAEMLGYGNEELLKKSIFDLIDQETMPAAEYLREQQLAGSGAQIDFKFIRKNGSALWTISNVSPIFDGEGNYIGSLGMVTDITERKAAEKGLRASEERNRLLYEAAERRFAQTAALRKIDTAITNSLDLKFTLDVVITQAIQHLGVDAADILLYNQDSKALTYFIGQGFRTRGIEKAFVPLGKSHAGLAVLKRRRINIPNLTQDLSAFAEASDFVDEGFVDFHTVPLVAKGKVLGVLETFRRSSFTPDEEWVHFLETLAGQAAIAIENIKLFEDLQRANDGLVVGYEAAIAGWSRALDLRDKETEGHSQRVTDLTLRLSRAIGVPESDLAHVRHGALLHDIGKMGVPDSILLKPAELSEEEWKVMKQHPDFAAQMLSPIAYLEEVIDIPFSHHEKWDGSGYPRGLSGTQIPLSARIFAVADVYDALTSRRPYREAWTKEKALAYIRSESGKHFDPSVVKAFLDLDLSHSRVAGK